MSVLRLQHTRTDGEVDTYHLKSVRRYHLGRGSDCEVRVLDMKMSRRHAAIERQGSEWVLHDLGSTNGARVDGVKIPGSVVLKPGNVIRIGNSDLTVAGIDDDGCAEPEAMGDLTPVRQEALPSTEASDEHADRNIDNEDLESRRVDVRSSSEFDLTDAPAAAADESPALEPTPRHAHPTPQPGRSNGERIQGVVVQQGEGESQLFINLLGRRVGPLSHAQARELKARELKGTLTADDLADYPLA